MFDSSGKSGSVDSWLNRYGLFDGYYVAFIMVSEYSAPAVVIPRSEKDHAVVRVSPGQHLAWSWELTDTAEINALVILAQRDEPFDPDTLRSELLERFPRPIQDNKITAPYDVRAMVNFLNQRAPGATDFRFKTVKNGVRCGH